MRHNRVSLYVSGQPERRLPSWTRKPASSYKFYE